jgi:sporulation protein YlmC with PRC-barrel domain
LPDIELSPNAEIYCSDGPVGRVIYILVNHIKNEITHLVLREDAPPHMERLVPLDRVSQSSIDKINVDCTRAEINKLEPFNFVEFIDVQDFSAGPNYIFWPFVTPGTHWVSLEGKQIPHNELAFRRGAMVEATDGRVGKVGEFLVDPKSGHITHIVLREGHLWGTREVSIPISAVAHVGEEHVYLNLDQETIEKLPEIPIQRRYLWKSH